MNGGRMLRVVRLLLLHENNREEIASHEIFRRMSDILHDDLQCV